MATLVPDTPPTSPSFHRRRKSWARRVERICCTTLSYFPLTFVYGLTTWAVWVEVIACVMDSPGFASYFEAGLGVALYAAANVSYTTAVFTSPGSPLDSRQDLAKGHSSRSNRARYESLPTDENEDSLGTRSTRGPMTTVTAKNNGEPRYCKKCRCVKPDRAHHCSSCGRCVLKMDHHCPWLATCVGLRNYKAFLLFLTYTSLFCWLCFAVSSRWVWRAIIADSHIEERSLRVVNCIMLAVLGGIIGLVLSCFTGWHIYLAATGQTTIECLEKTRYLSPLRKHLAPQPQGQRNYFGDVEAQTGAEQGLLDQLKETHANALPGVLRPEEGEEPDSRSLTPIPPTAPPSENHHRLPQTPSPAKASLQRSFASLEDQRERERYAAYLDEQDSEKLPNAFDLGWRSNLTHVMGDRPLLWFLPVCNTSGDGWMWDVSPKWTAARAEVAREREARDREDAVWDRDRESWGQWNSRPPTSQLPPPPRDLRTGALAGPGPFPMQPLDRRSPGMLPQPGISAGPPNGYWKAGVGDNYDTSSEEDEPASRNQRNARNFDNRATSDWNDIPDDMIASRGRSANGNASGVALGRRKGD